MTVLGLIFFILAPWIIALFTSDPEIQRYGINCLRILSVGYPMYAVGMIVIQALNGAGDTRTPSLLNFVAFWTMQIPLAYWMATSVGMGPNGVFTAIVLSESALTVLGVMVFRRGKWRTQVA